MGMTDPIADMLTRIRNAARARHESVAVPWSRTKEEIAKVLVAEGFLLEARRIKGKEWSGEELLIQIRFDMEKQPIISGLKRISRPGRRVYVGSEGIPLIRGGLGVNILSTSRGILVDREAKKVNVGGELICSVW
ncbi:MAG: 30S ribosomal protein S8 [Deltaproteobacteria bacterium]|nr:30S ribosomal protein S8 [Deltaproteobacteria bacterium]